MKEVLEYTEKALNFLKKEKRHVDSLLRLCERVKHLIKGDILTIMINKAEGPQRRTPQQNFTWGEGFLTCVCFEGS